MNGGVRPDQRPIALLAPRVAQRIAAGEIVERPASVVRELVENALDAGATTIGVEVRGGGTELIAVADDGWGIPAAEIELAVQRHATSKVAEIDDLEHIETLGFRGEALPSIASVSTLEIVSATDADAFGMRLVVQDGVMVELAPVARTRGTTVRVRELFGALPVRRGFLPSARAESARLLDMARRYALAWPEVRLTFTIDGRQIFRSSGLGEAAVLATVFGITARRLRPFGPVEIDDGQLSGLVGDPGLTRADRDGIVIIVNRRWVQPQRWLQMLERAYRPLVPRGRHPVAVIRLSVRPRAVEVNLHPAKLEARLAAEDLTLVTLAESLRVSLGHTPAEASLVAPLRGKARQRTLPLPRRSLREESESYGERLDIRSLRTLGQLQDTLIVAASASAMYLIDQHRAEERYLYEQLLAHQPHDGSQELLEPLRLELRKGQEARLSTLLPDLEALGFGCERFGRRSFLIRATPVGIPATAAGALAGAIEAGIGEDEGWRERLIAAVACGAAIRRGVALDDDGMQRLLTNLARCAVPVTCPHGSPIVAVVHGTDLARHFNWR